MADDKHIMQHIKNGNVKQVKKWLFTGGKKIGKLTTVAWKAGLRGNLKICLLLVRKGAKSKIILPEEIMKCNISKKEMKRKLAGEIKRNIVEACSINDHVHVLKRLKAVNFNQSDLVKSLNSACAHGSCESLEWLIAKLDLKGSEKIKWRFATVCSTGDLDSVIKNHDDHNKQISTEMLAHALNAASQSGKTNIIAWLLQNTDANINMKHHDVLPIIAASSYGHRNAVTFLVHQYADSTQLLKDIEEKKLKDTLLHLIISRDNGWTPLHEACDDGDEDKVDNLLGEITRNRNVSETCSQIDLQDSYGRTPLHLACRNGDLKIVQKFLSVFANTKIVNAWNETPGDEAKYTGNDWLTSHLKPTCK